MKPVKRPMHYVKTHPVIPGLGEILEFIQTLRPDYQAVATTILRTGARASELLSVSSSEVVERGRLAEFQKKDMKRHVPIGPVVAQELLRYIHNERCEIVARIENMPATDALFIDYAGRPITRNKLDTEFLRANRVLNRKSLIKPHTITHVRRHAHLHASLEMTRYYYNSMDRAEIEKTLSRAFAALPTQDEGVAKTVPEQVDVPKDIS